MFSFAFVVLVHIIILPKVCDVRYINNSMFGTFGDRCLWPKDLFKFETLPFRRKCTRTFLWRHLEPLSWRAKPPFFFLDHWDLLRGKKAPRHHWSPFHPVWIITWNRGLWLKDIFSAKAWLKWYRALNKVFYDCFQLKLPGNMLRTRGKLPSGPVFEADSQLFN